VSEGESAEEIMGYSDSDSVFIIDDDPESVKICALYLGIGGIKRIYSSLDPEKGFEEIGERKPSVVILDLCYSEICGHNLLKRIVEEHPDIPVIIITGITEVESAVKCMKVGAFDYIVKSMMSMGQLLTAVKQAFEYKRRFILNAPEQIISLNNPFSHLSCLPSISDVKDFLVDEALRRTGGRQNEAARLIGMTPSGLNKALKRKQKKD
jgi:DNA-binding NtrC family response regulator